MLQSQKVYEQLRRDITGQRLKPGESLHEASLSERYEASRTPVREALFRLRQEGFIEKSGRQLHVKEFTFPEVEELYQLREGLEKMAVRLCIERASNAELDEIQAQLDSYHEFDVENDYESFNEHANLFHRSVSALCGNIMIQKQLEAIHDKALAINARYWRVGNSVDEAYNEHGYILRAIRERDVTVAEAAIRAHIQGIVRLYRQSNWRFGDRDKDE